jgi:hypothetical protein
MSRPKNMNDLFYDTLKDIYFAERQILKTLPKRGRQRGKGTIRLGTPSGASDVNGVSGVGAWLIQRIRRPRKHFGTPIVPFDPN